MLGKKQASLFLILLQLNASAQIFAPIDRTFAFKKRAELVCRLLAERPDSTRVLLLLDLSNAYLKLNTPDSALFYSDQAVHLGKSLHMTEEEGQAWFLACRADAMKEDIAAAEAITANAVGIWKMR